MLEEVVTNWPNQLAFACYSSYLMACFGLSFELARCNELCSLEAFEVAKFIAIDEDFVNLIYFCFGQQLTGSHSSSFEN